jgi:histone deacetylase 6
MKNNFKLLLLLLNRCRELGLMDRCKSLKPKAADNSDILAVHSEEAFNILRATSGSNNEEELEKLSSKYDAIYIHPVSNKVAYKVTIPHSLKNII